MGFMNEARKAELLARGRGRPAVAPPAEAEAAPGAVPAAALVPPAGTVGPVLFDDVAALVPPTWGEGCVVGAFCVIGVQPIATAANRRSIRANWPAGHVGARTVIGHHCVIGAGVVIGSDCRIGDHVNIREGVVIGDRCVIGTKVDLQFECRLGDDVKVFNETQIAGEMVVGSGTFIGPGVVTANDKRIDPLDYRDHGRHPPVVGRNVVIGMAAVLLPGVRIGDAAVVAAGALVTKDVDPGQEVIGRPARPRLAPRVPADSAFEPPAVDDLLPRG